MGFHFQQREVEKQREFHRGNGSSSVSLLYRVKEIKEKKCQFSSQIVLFTPNFKRNLCYSRATWLVLNLVTDNSERGMGILSGIRL